VLAILSQPSPAVLMRGKPLEETITVQLLLESTITIESVSDVKLMALISDKSQAKNAQDIEPESAKLNHQYQAKFKVKFNNGSRKNIALIKFGVQVKIAGGPLLILESVPSNPYVVITNEVQYEESDGLLLKYAFGKQTEISWFLFSNRLQKHFLVATKQDILNPKRILSTYDLQYLQATFFGGNAQVTLKQFDEFWNWFGPVLHKLRHQRQLTSMWHSGLIYGFFVS